MCGIVGYVGRRQALEVLMQGLRRLEYRGYDSAGVVVQNGHGLVSEKCAGRVASLEARLTGHPLVGCAGLGHTRWATHGGVTEANAHPHFSCDRSIAVVHNGIVENHADLRRQLGQHRFESATDTEVIPHLLESLYATAGHDLVRAVRLALERIRGSLAIVVMHAAHPGVLIAARINCPLVVGIGHGENFVASDIPALLPFTRRILPMEEGEIARLDPHRVGVFDRRLRARRRRAMTVRWDASTDARHQPPHLRIAAPADEAPPARYMGEEILEQASCIASEVRTRAARFGRLKIPAGIDRVVVAACGTAWHSGLVAKAAIEELARLPVDAAQASELRYGDCPFDSRTLLVAISQSGETADTLAAARTAREAGAPVLAITNARGSTLDREADQTVIMQAGPEVGVAATKTYTSQLMNVLFLAMRLGRVRGTLTPSRHDELAAEAQRLPIAVREVLACAPRIETLAARHLRGCNFMFVGRRYNLATAYEGALKMKEITYEAAEGYGAGEMKHGPLALVDERMVCVAVAPQGRTTGKCLSNIEEIRARGGRIVAVATRGDAGVAAVSDDVFEIPPCEEMFSPVLAVIPLQLLAYFRAVRLGRDVDKPRNLAKSVTVE